MLSDVEALNALDDLVSLGSRSIDLDGLSSLDDRCGRSSSSGSGGLNGRLVCGLGRNGRDGLGGGSDGGFGLDWVINHR